jgi:superfamily II DNA/RNA helicase
MPQKIRQLARAILHDPAEINIAISKPPEKIVQKAFVVYEPQKLPLIKHLLKTTAFKNALIFCSRKQTVKQLTRELKHGGFNIGEIHSDLEQAQREEVLSSFINGRIPIMVATDILSRGIDIDTIHVVINYDVPHDGEDYVHRIGRTARAEADGMAFTLIGEKPYWEKKWRKRLCLSNWVVRRLIIPVAVAAPVPGNRNEDLSMAGLTGDRSGMSRSGATTQRGRS